MLGRLLVRIIIITHVFYHLEIDGHPRASYYFTTVFLYRTIDLYFSFPHS